MHPQRDRDKPRLDKKGLYQQPQREPRQGTVLLELARARLEDPLNVGGLI